MKTCTKCGESKEETEFFPDGRTKDGLRPYCKTCCGAKGTKVCPCCGKEKATSDFYPRSTNRGTNAWCKSCENEDKRARYAAMTQEEKQDWLRAHKDYRMRRMYGISLAEANELAAKQGHRCAICKGALKANPSTDHCHKTGKVRAILCNPCNVALGLFKESVEVLQNAIEYLKYHESP